jgi:hypothetical protein
LLALHYSFDFAGCRTARCDDNGLATVASTGYLKEQRLQSLGDWQE